MGGVEAADLLPAFGVGEDDPMRPDAKPVVAYQATFEWPDVAALAREGAKCSTNTASWGRSETADELDDLLLKPDPHPDRNRGR